MRLACVFPIAIVLTAVPVCAQNFDPAMPPAVPRVAGPVAAGPMLRYIDIKAGDGAAAAPGKQYTVQYSGWLRDGTQFDSSVGKDPLTFVQGRRQVIAGFDLGFEGMKVGGKRRIFIPYQMAYGEQGRGKIPPKSELIFDIELLAVKDASQLTPLSDLMLPFGELQDHIMALAKAVPEEKYGWRPAADARSFREVFLHIGYAIHLQLLIANGATKEEVMKQIAVQNKGQVEPLSKDQVLKLLTDRLAEAKEALDNARPGGLTRDIDFFGTPTTQRGVLDFLNTHMAEHLGQAIAYARMNGIVPPWSAR